MASECNHLKKELAIGQIVSIHSFEYVHSFSFPEESHDFWEFLYVDKGTVRVTAQSMAHTLTKGDIIFHQPHELHRIQANGNAVPGLVAVGFSCASPTMEFFRGKRLETGPSQRTLISNLIGEARLSYSSRLDDPCCRELVRREGSAVPFGSEQLVHIYLQQLLIQLIRENEEKSPSACVPSSGRKRREDELFYRIVSYMEEHIGEHLSIPQICKDNLIGRSLLQQLFRDYTGCGVIDYFSMMKVNAAKQLIRRQQMNFSQIAEYLGYNSIHYFSRQFKKLAGMTPSEYAARFRK